MLAGPARCTKRATNGKNPRDLMGLACLAQARQDPERGGPQGREDAGRFGAAIRCASEPDHGLEGATGWRRGGGVRCLWGCDGSGGGREDIARQDWGADAGERFFVRGAREGGAAERKTMMDRGGAVPRVRQAELLRLSRRSVYYEPRTVPAAELAIMRRIDELHLEHPF